MKRYITVLALSALVCSSCSDFLDVQKETQLQPPIS